MTCSLLIECQGQRQAPASYRHLYGNFGVTCSDAG